MRSETPAPGENTATDPQLLDTLAGLNADAGRAIVLRTRHAVRGSLEVASAQRQNRKRNAGIAILVAVVVLMVLSPAIWSGMEDLNSGEYIFDMTPMMTLLAVVLSSAVLAALIAGWKNDPRMRDGKRHE